MFILSASLTHHGMGIEAHRKASLSRPNDRIPMSCKKALLAIIRQDIDAEMYCNTKLRIVEWDNYPSLTYIFTRYPIRQVVQ